MSIVALWMPPKPDESFSTRTVYNLVQNHIRKLDGFSAEVDELAAEAIEHYDEEAPLLSNTQ